MSDDLARDIEALAEAVRQLQVQLAWQHEQHVDALAEMRDDYGWSLRERLRWIVRGYRPRGPFTASDVGRSAFSPWQQRVLRVVYGLMGR